MTAPAKSIRLLVCGNADRGDDGAALAAVAHLLPRIEDGVRQRIDVRRCLQLDPTDLIDVPVAEACVVVDTVVGIEPGSTVTLALGDLAGDGQAVLPRSSHALPIGQVLGIAEAVRGQLPAGMFVGIGGQRFEFGARRSRSVSLGMCAFERAIEVEIRRFATTALVAAPAAVVAAGPAEGRAAP
jgi:hydrogenase maturation protease